MNFPSRLFRCTIVSFAFLLTASICSAQTVSVKKDNVNVRSGPATSFPVSMELFKGYPLKSGPNQR